VCQCMARPFVEPLNPTCDAVVWSHCDDKLHTLHICNFTFRTALKRCNILTETDFAQTRFTLSTYLHAMMGPSHVGHMNIWYQDRRFSTHITNTTTYPYYYILLLLLTQICAFSQDCALASQAALAVHSEHLCTRGLSKSIAIFSLCPQQQLAACTHFPLTL
jgi:hypothetical protein